MGEELPSYAGATQTQEKGQTGHQPQQQQQQQQMQASQYFDTRRSFHVYKAAGLFSKDDIVTGDDKQAIIYYLEFPIQFFSGFNMTLHLGSKNGQPLLKITKSNFSSTLTLATLPNEFGIGIWRRELVRTGIFTKSHEFLSLDGITIFKWSSDGYFSGNLICYRKNGAQRIVVATWRRTAFSIGKDGHLIISPGYERDTILLVASALAMDEWSREEDRRRRR